ncbi:hypothetical protein ACFPMF_23070 [Larkinella bovis]|uniref:Uncharacterized protein n=1 Tax=Larkinella bovis TaxID=683041 RepID=A0ABW0IFK1_9BACT
MWLFFMVSCENKHFKYYETDLETLMEILNNFVSEGYQLKYAFLIDHQGGRTDLPVDVFDGAPIAERMHDLEMQYQLVLRF